MNFDAAPLSIFMDPGSSDVIAADAVVGGVRFDNCSVLDDRPVWPKQAFQPPSLC